MRFPLSMTAGMAGYIFKNKLMPRREWQQDAKPKAEAANPFRILPSGFGEAEGLRPMPHPMMKKRFPIVLMLEHTRKNKMILAERCRRPAARSDVTAQVAAIKSFYGIRTQCLETLLTGDPESAARGSASA